MRTTLGHILNNTRVPNYLKLGKTDARVVQFINEAVQRLVMKGPWWGCIQKYRVCATDGCLTWPRHVAAIWSVAIDKTPIRPVSRWFEFIEYGWGLRDANVPENILIPNGTAATFDDIQGTNSHIKVYADVPEAANAQILLRGYDANWNWIRTQVGGVWIDGEYVDINSATPATSTKVFRGALDTPIKPVTNGAVRLYEVKDDATERVLAIYEPDEERPEYVRSLIPGLSQRGGTGSCDQIAVTIMAKMEYYPVSEDNDFILIGNETAIKHGAKACQLEEEGKLDEAALQMQLAVQALEEELAHHIGPQEYQPLVVASGDFGAGSTPNPVTTGMWMNYPYRR